MVLYDYLFQFTTELEAQTALTDWVFTDEDGKKHWRPKEQGTGIIPVDIVAADATFAEDEETILTPLVIVPGFWLAISTPDSNDELYDIAQCVQETARPQIPTPVSQTIIRTKLQSEQYSNFIRVSPVFAGALYLWGQ